MSEKKIGGRRACLGDILQNIAEMGFFAHCSRGAWGELYKKWLKSNNFQTFQLILPILNLTARRNNEIF